MTLEISISNGSIFKDKIEIKSLDDEYLVNFFNAIYANVRSKIIKSHEAALKFETN